VGWTRANGPNRSALSWKPNPRIMLAIPASHTGRRTSRRMRRGSKPVTSLVRAPRRWHTDAVAVQKLAATARMTAASIAAASAPGGQTPDADRDPAFLGRY
jgi:hypothetical protein